MDTQGVDLRASLLSACWQLPAARLVVAATAIFASVASGASNDLLCNAAQRGNLEAVRTLLQQGTPLNGYYLGSTPLMCAARYGHLEVMKLLLDSGADVHARQNNPGTYPPPTDTALMIAARYGRPGAAQLLLERGARVNDKGTWEFTALTLAAEGCPAQCRPRLPGQDYAGTVRILLKHGADPNFLLKGQQGGTPLMLALRNLRGEGNETVKVLLEGGANPNVRGAEGETALMIAVKQRNLEAVRLLVSKGADLTVKDDQGRTAVQFARMLAFREIEQLLLGRDTPQALSIGAATAESTKPSAPVPRIAKTLWKVALGARPLSGGPWLADSLVIHHTMTMTNPPGGRLIALAARTGAMVWEAKTDAPNISPPAIAEGVLFIGDQRRGLLSASGRLLALQLATGKIVWEFPTSAIEISEPLVRGRAVYVRSGRDWYAIDRSTGKELWHVRADSSSAYPPVLSGSTVLLGEIGGRLVAVDAQSGRAKWQFAPSEGFPEGEQFQREAARAARTRQGQELFKVTGPRELYPFGIHICEAILQGQTQSEIVASFAASLEQDAAAALFVAARKTVCPPGTTREQVSAAARRAQLSTGKETLQSLPSVFGDKVFFRAARTGADAGSIYAVETESGRVLMRWPTRFGIGGTPVADDKAIYFMDMRDLIAVAIPGRERLWSLDLQNENVGADAPLLSVGNQLYVAGVRLLKIDRTTGTIEWRMSLEGISGILRPGKNQQDGHICAPLFEQIGRNSNQVYNVNLAAGNVAWAVRLSDFGQNTPIACDDRMLFYYHDDRGSYPAYGVELVEPGSSTN